jgi:hypothetical protein
MVQLASGGIDYETIIREQMAGAVRRVLTQVAGSGLPGGHALYVEFATGHPRAKTPAWLKAKYPVRMGIILENQFWNLKVGEDCFSVQLSFDGRHEEIAVPFDSLYAFRDEGAGISLKFLPREAPQDTCGVPPPGGRAGGEAPGDGTSGNVVSLFGRN